LLGPYGSGNLGDAAIQEAAIRNLRRIQADTQIVGICGNPEDTLERHGIHSVFISPPRKHGAFTSVPVLRQFLAIAQRLSAETVFTISAYRLMASTDLLVISGGGQIDEYWGGVWHQPFDVFRWTVLAKIARTRVAVVSVGLCKLEKSLSKVLFRTSLRMADYRSFRDRGTLEFVVGELGIRKPCHVTADLAFSFPLQSVDKIAVNPSNGRVVVGISPIAYSAWTDRTYPEYRQYMTALQELVRATIKKGRDVRLFPSQVKMDREPVLSLVPEDSQENVKGRESVVANPVQFLEDLLREINVCDVVVASRLHGVLLAILMRKPVVAISYDRKVRALMQDLGCSEMCIDLDEITASSVSGIVEKAIDRRTELHDLADVKATEWAKALEKQYVDILKLLH